MLPAERLSYARLDCGKSHRVDDVVNQGTPAEVVNWLGEALQHGADAHYVGAALHSFVRRVASVEIREDEDVRASGHRTAGPLALSYRSDGCGVVLQWAVNGQIGLAFAHDPGRLGDLVDIAAGTRGAGAEADHRHSGFDAEGPCRRRALDGDVGQVFGTGPRVDGAITVNGHLIGKAHEKHRRHRRLPDLVPRICSAGRIVAAVVWTAPATMPSTPPCWSIIVPTMIGSARRSRAISSVQSRCRRSGTSVAT